MRPYDERLDHFLSRAARVFADKGYHSTTMRDLAAATGMSLAGMYYYVQGKGELLYRIQERCFTQVLPAAEQVLAWLRSGGADPIERRQAFLRHYLVFLASDAGGIKVRPHD